jgi:hypothetical protein
MELAFSTINEPAASPISPLMELGAYEALWLEEGASVKKIADRFAADPHALPSDFDDLRRIYRIDEQIAEPEPKAIGIIDDVLTAGSHFRAMKDLLLARFPNVPITGIFIARRVFPNDDLSEFFLITNLDT